MPSPAIQERGARSLFGEILDWMLAPLLLLWPLSIAITYLVAKAIANQPFDRALEDKLKVLTQHVKIVAGQPKLELSAAALDFLKADDQDKLYFQIRSSTGQIIAGDTELPWQEEEKLTPGILYTRQSKYHDDEIRIAYAQLEWYAGAQANEKQYLKAQIAETLEKRNQLATEIIKGVVLPQFIILPIALTLVWFALSRGLSPLSELQRRIRSRRPDDLSPIDTLQVPEEITPLVNSLNDMLARLEQSIALQKRFIADAAHQMKTPLAGMRMQAELALRQSDLHEVQQSLHQLANSSETATRLVNQLLSLARAENQSQSSGNQTALELNQLVRQVVQDWISVSFTQQIDLGIELTDEPSVITGNALMLREMLGNLIDNALHYTPPSGHVTVRVRNDHIRRLCILEVEDNGPGIAPAERERVFQRFYRILGSSVSGSGLGLAIVKEIVQQHQAQIFIQDGRDEMGQIKGTLFRIEFPGLSDQTGVRL